METRQLANVADIITGTTPSNRAIERGVPYIQIKDLDPAKRSLVAGAIPSAKRATPSRSGDVLLAARGGQTAVVGEGPGAGLESAFPTLDVYLIRPDTKRLEPAYLAAWLTQESVLYQLQASTTGVLIPRIPIGSLKALPIPLPPLLRQRMIGRLFHLACEEATLLECLTTQKRLLRARQLAAAFATTGAATP